jgi:hypothetical protein
LQKGEYKTKIGIVYADIYNELLKMAETAYEAVGILVPVPAAIQNS